jgi:hypothetical protein
MLIRERTHDVEEDIAQGTMHRVDPLSQQKKWAEKLSTQCGLSSTFLNKAIEELSESCFGDARTSREIIEELTLSCHLDKNELSKFLGEVSKNCPFDAKKLLEMVLKAEGNKHNLLDALTAEGTRWATDRGGAR